MLHKILGFFSLVMGGIVAFFSLLDLTLSIIESLGKELSLNVNPSLFGVVLFSISLILGIAQLICGYKLVKGSKSKIVIGLSIFSMIGIITLILLLLQLVIFTDWMYQQLS